MAVECVGVAGEALVAHRFGIPGARPKVYLQRAFHTEVSATAALAELVDLLREADADGRFSARLSSCRIAILGA